MSVLARSSDTKTECWLGLKKDFACVDAALWVIEPVMAEDTQEPIVGGIEL